MRFLINNKLDENFYFYLYRLLAAFFPLLLVFLSKIFLSASDFAIFQSDYTLILFGASLSSIGLGVVAQIVGAKNPTLHYEIVLLSFCVFVFILLLNFFFNEVFLKILPLTNNDLIVRYLWPSYLFIVIIPNYYLGGKQYLSFFLPSIIFIFFLIVGLFLKLHGASISIFIFAFLFNFIYFLREFILIKDQKKITNFDFPLIYKLLRVQTLPFYSGTIGIKNYPYYIIKFYGVAVFGEIKLLISIFNLLNFVLSSKIIFFSNKILKSGYCSVSASEYNKIVFFILRANFIFLFCLFIFSFFSAILPGLSILLPFTLFNIGMNFALLDNQFYFATGKSYLRIINDIVIVLFLYFIWIIIDFIDLKSSVELAIYTLIASIFIVNIINFVRSKIIP